MHTRFPALQRNPGQKHAGAGPRALGSYSNTPTVTTTPTTSVFSDATFIYDGDGKRVASETTTDVATNVTHFVGNHYEVTDGVVTKYYFAGAQRIAMSKDGTLSFLLGDHLGSTSLVTDINRENAVNRTYTPYSSHLPLP